MHAFHDLTPDEIERTTARLRRVARAWVDEAQAEDLVQGAWLRILDGNARGARRLVPFLVGVVRQLARREALSDHRRRVREHRRDRAEAEPSPEELLERIEAAGRIAAAIGALPEPLRTTLLLRYDEDLSAAEIARRQGVPAATVRARLKRGRDLLRERLAKEDPRSVSWAGFLVPWTRLSTGGSPLAGVLAMASVGKGMMAACAAVVIATGFWLGSGDRGVASAELALEGDEVATLAVLEVEEAPETRVLREEVGAPSAASLPTAGVREVRGLLADGESGTPLEHYEFEVTDTEGLTVRGTSDAAGTFAVSGRFASGPLELRAIDHERMAGMDTFNFEDQRRAILEEAGTFALRTGPTYVLSGSLPPGTAVEDFDAELRPLGPGGLIGLGHAPLRGESGLWVRFSPGVVSMHGTGPWRISVRSHDGMWAGSAEVSVREGRVMEPVVLEITARGSLVGSFEVDGVPLDGLEGWPTMEPLDGREMLYAEPERGTASFLREHMSPGEYVLRLEDRRLEPVAMPFTIEPGRTLNLEVPVSKRDDLAAISGVLRSETPVAFQHGTLVLMPAGKRTRQEMLYINIPGTHLEAPFRFEDVPPGEYVISLLQIGLELAEGEVPVAHGAAALVLPVRTTEVILPSKHAFQVLSRGTGEPVRYPRLAVGIGGHSSIITGDAEGQLEFEARRGEIRLSITAAGYRPYREVLEFPEDAPSEVLLEEGWGRLLRLIGPDRKPAPWVEITMDGLVAGTTDGRGEVMLEGDTQPGRIGVESEAWRMTDSAGGMADMELLDMRDAGPLLYLYLQARE